ncbi:MAG: bifunctional riboflavin kinase/FAD synthetase [Candidatus Azobacteroides sp.]|nr:bifunctional riboflavin kinase/FAD synthetase [Candidatus Azobacteroides sp.]
MEIIRSNHLSRLSAGTAATIGFFDGVHAGHRFLLEQLKTQAHAHQLPSMVITFLQHPQTVLQPGFQPKLLSTFDERIERLSESGIDYCLLQDFTPSLSGLDAQTFIQKKLKEEWFVKLLLIGYNHRFGKNRAEGFEDYVKYGKACGMEILQASKLPDMSVSSTHIRNYLSERNVKEANRMLSYFYRLEGKVIEGNHWGRELGFPTANLEISDTNKIIPGEGIYALLVYQGEKKYKGMVYIGQRPTLTIHGEKRIEVHLFDFSGDLYGETLQLEFVEFLREGRQFENTEELKKQLFADREAALAALTGLE